MNFVLVCLIQPNETFLSNNDSFSVYLCSLSFWLTLPRRVQSTSGCCPFRPWDPTGRETVSQYLLEITRSGALSVLTTAFTGRHVDLFCTECRLVGGGLGTPLQHVKANVWGHSVILFMANSPQRLDWIHGTTGFLVQQTFLSVFCPLHLLTLPA